MSVRKLIVQYVGDVLLLPKLERDVMHIYERDRIGRTVREYVPIVRCRNCKHMHTVRHWLGMDVDECWLHADRESGALGKERTEPDGFCAWAERREQ